MFLTANYFIFHFFSGFSVICSLMVVSAKNPIHSVLFLILTFFNLSCLLFILNVEFLPLLFLIVYVGAIAVLFLFVLIMLNIKLSELKEGSKQYFFIALIFGIIFLVETLLVFNINFSALNLYCLPLQKAQESLLSFGFCFDFSTWCFKHSNILYLGELFFTSFAYLFVALGFVLLLAMIGAITLTLKKNFITKSQDVYNQILRDSNHVIIKYSKEI
uniref:NADH-ubiquinone oxidoreductase chain 6 n=1 Tax=Phaeocystis globosa TaxID=33658 RepID=S5FR79_9EUKA|nr:NADH dehydrogenase subunit 6 [Phaeocystis globosa]